MKQANLIINVILILAVGTLFALHFTSGEKGNEAGTPSENRVINDSTVVDIAYVQIDTVLNKMKMYKDLTEKLGKKQQEMETKMASQYKSFEKEVADFQNKAQKGLITRSEAQTLEQQLGAKGNQLETQRNNYLMELQEENLVSQNKIIDYIMSYLEEYNADGQYKYILSYSFGGGILFASDRLDITPEVVVGLNEKYDKLQAEK
jgi:outer membrane protein